MIRFLPLFAVGLLCAADLVAIPVGKADYQIWRGDDQLLSIETRVMDHDWKQPEMAGQPTVTEGTRRWTTTGAFPVSGDGGKKGGKENNGGTPFRFTYTARAAGKSLQLSTSTTADTEVQAVGVMTMISTTDWLSGGTGVSTQADGTQVEFTLPVGMGNQGKATTAILLKSRTGEEMHIKASRPVTVASDKGELRIWAWQDRLAAKTESAATLTFSFSSPITVETANRLVDTGGWIPYAPRQDFTPGSAIGAENWLDAPAGKHGWVQLEGEHFVFEKQRKPFKFWGTNIAFARMAVAPEVAREWAAKFAKYGVNIVRMHKFTGNQGWDGVMHKDDVLAFDEEPSKRFDHIHAQLKERGIYVGWSPIFSLRLHESMAKHLKHYDEIKAGVAKRKDLFANSLYPLQNVSDEVQDLYIKLTVAFLERKNTVTGLRYADDPAVAYVELHNEADIFFFGTGKLLQNYPTYTKQMQERFAAWLRTRYADDAALKAAWGELKKGESLAQATILPFPPFDGKMPAPRRVVDCYRFLYAYQVGFYDRYTAAIRKTGYRGAIVGGCWQAGDMYGHLYNIASDRHAGFIDRHNYFKGERPMVTQPGSALLSAGMQQVADRPFGLTEWAGGHIWGAECQPVLGLVGLGLQGWDYSAQFASSNSFVLTENNGGINGNFDEFRATIQHPFIARFLYSGALKSGEVVGSRRISMQELDAGQVGFEERFSLLGGANLKNFSGSVPNEALGAGRVTLDFVDQPVQPAIEMANLAKYWNKEQRLITASNGQMRWDYSGRGCITTDTPVAQAVIGFGGGREHRLSTATVRYDVPFANVYLAARKPGETLAETKEIVVLTLARTANRGDVLEETSMTAFATADMVEKSKNPEEARAFQMANPRLLIEPVKATITLARTGPCTVIALDHDGCKPAQAKPIAVRQVAGGVQFDLDGAAAKAFTYLVTFP